VNGEVVDTLGTRVDPDSSVELTQDAQIEIARKVTILVNKPVGFVSSQPENSYRCAEELITQQNQDKADTTRMRPEHTRGLAPAGRLDIESQGLLIYSQDRVLIKSVIGPESNLEKEYLVRIQGNVTDQTIEQLRFGLSLDGKALKPAGIERLNEDQLKFILREGKKRQIRRMCDLVGLRVIGLKRVRVGKLMLGNLPEGQWRYLKDHEYGMLVSTTPPSPAPKPKFRQR